MLTSKRNCSTQNRTQQKSAIHFLNTFFNVLHSDSTQKLYTRKHVLLYICAFAPDATRLAQSPLTLRDYVACSLGASTQAAKECGCRGEAAKTQR